jgi:hypothetical protein
MMLPTLLGFPDIFLTMTCNPRWPEIVDNIPLGADASLGWVGLGFRGLGFRV